MKKIKITLRKDGTQKVEALGVVGESCLELTKALEHRLGVEASERTLKPEFEIESSEFESEREREAGS
jgi:hypothetical protein